MNELLEVAEHSAIVEVGLSQELVDARFAELAAEIQATPESREASHVPARKSDGRNDPQREFQEK